jgi:hypothetical protein
MGKEIVFKDKSTKQCITVNCDKFLYLDGDPGYFAIHEGKVYKRIENNVYEFIGDFK